MTPRWRRGRTRKRRKRWKERRGRRCRNGRTFVCYCLRLLYMFLVSWGIIVFSFQDCLSYYWWWSSRWEGRAWGGRKGPGRIRCRGHRSSSRSWDQRLRSEIGEWSGDLEVSLCCYPFCFPDYLFHYFGFLGVFRLRVLVVGRPGCRRVAVSRIWSPPFLPATVRDPCPGLDRFAWIVVVRCLFFIVFFVCYQ